MSVRLLPIVLAAGESRRMGQPKLFLPLYGSTLLRLAVHAALDLQAALPTMVVTGAYDQEIREHLTDLADRIIFVFNPDWKSGMSCSIANGVKAASELKSTHFLITLADQPLMGVESLAFLADESLRWPQSIIATQYPERAGVPAIFPASYADRLTFNTGVIGARQLIKDEKNTVRVITFHQPPKDIDTWEDYLAAGGSDQHQQK